MERRKLIGWNRTDLLKRRSTIYETLLWSGKSGLKSYLIVNRSYIDKETFKKLNEEIEREYARFEKFFGKIVSEDKQLREKIIELYELGSAKEHEFYRYDVKIDRLSHTRMRLTLEAFDHWIKEMEKKIRDAIDMDRFFEG